MHYEFHGRQDADAPTLVLSAGLGGVGSFFASDIAVLGQHYRVLTYDQAGTGNSPATLGEHYSIRDMAEELHGLLRTLQIERCQFMGHALGGLIGLELALIAPQRLTSLTLVNAWAEPNPHSRRCFAIRKHLLNDTGPAAYLHAQAIFLYPADWIAANSDRLAAMEAAALQHFPTTPNLLRRIQALEAFDISTRLGEIDVPTLVIANRDDMLVPWQQSQRLAEGLNNARFELLEYGGHASSITDPEPFHAITLDFFKQPHEARHEQLA